MNNLNSAVRDDVDAPPVESFFQLGLIDDLVEVKWKSRAKLISMNIDDFLLMCPPSMGNNEKSDRVSWMIKNGEKFDSIPFLIVSAEGSEATVCGHEGRHRAMELKKLGYSEVPVILQTNIRWSEQDGASRYDHHAEWPERMISSRSQDISIQFPVKRSDCMKPYENCARAEIGPDLDHGRMLKRKTSRPR